MAPCLSLMTSSLTLHIPKFRLLRSRHEKMKQARNEMQATWKD